MVSTRRSSRGSDKPAIEIEPKLCRNRGQQDSLTNTQGSLRLLNATSQAQAKSNKSRSSEKPSSTEPIVPRRSARLSGASSSQASSKVSQSPEELPATQRRTTKKFPAAKSEPLVEKTAPKYSRKHPLTEPTTEIPIANAGALRRRVKSKAATQVPAQHSTTKGVPMVKSEPIIQKAKSKNSRKRPFTESTPEISLASVEALHQQTKLNATQAPEKPSSGERASKKARTASPDAPLPQVSPEEAQSPEELPSKEPVDAKSPSATPPPKILRVRYKPENEDTLIADTPIEDVWTQTIYRRFGNPEWLTELREHGITKMGDLPGFDGKGMMSRFKFGIKKFFEKELQVEFKREWKHDIGMMRNQDFKYALSIWSRVSFHEGWEEVEMEDGNEDDEGGATPGGTRGVKRRRNPDSDEGGPPPKKGRVLLHRASTPEYLQPDRSLGKEAMRVLGVKAQAMLQQLQMFIDIYGDELEEEAPPGRWKTRLEGVEQRLQELAEKLERMSVVMGGLKPRVKVKPGRKWARRSSAGASNP
ncbi:hypothetical protein TWF506_000439 [Arthrobotrys conoides]|uniref:Uncharacterized protein n=1 Tax=Arthrobotrys conoides TaxID=74498 RepID=A0AAN8S491_9PEZI